MMISGFQQMVELDEGEFVIKPGESIQTHCWYDTRARTKDVGFGFSTKDEVSGAWFRCILAHCATALLQRKPRVRSVGMA